MHSVTKNCLNKLFKKKKKNFKFSAFSLEFQNFFSITRSIYSNSERSEQFLVCFHISNKLGHLEFKLEKNIGIEKHAGKVRKSIKPKSPTKFCSNATVILWYSRLRNRHRP